MTKEMKLPSTRQYQICRKCVMDTSDPDIVFTEDGVCNHCLAREKWEKERAIPPHRKKAALATEIAKIKEAGKGKKYDCLIGVSGGVDSSYVAYLVCKMGLRPLAVHFDNGWNSEIANRNIENLVKILKIDFYTHVVDWEEFKDMQRAFIKASVVDAELPTDNGIWGVMMRQVFKHKIRYLISGINTATEFYPLPVSWRYTKSDDINIKDIHKKFGNIGKAKTFPYYGTRHLASLLTPWGLKYLKILDYVDYNKDKVKELMKKEVQWQDYGHKHFENIFTKMYQAYILPVKFGFDKRRAHYSSLIWSNQMNREEALESLKKPQFTERELKDNIEYLCKKLDFEVDEFNALMKEKPKSHYEYATNELHEKILYKLFDTGKTVKNFLFPKLNPRNVNGQ